MGSHGENLPVTWNSSDDWPPDQKTRFVQGCAYRRIELQPGCPKGGGEGQVPWLGRGTETETFASRDQ